tara:strand:+ start:3284 stop:3520 length:237 start_codon:yes stop_codon:yes gene_type:complete
MKKNIFKILIIAQIACAGLTKNTKTLSNSAAIEQNYKILKLKQALYANSISSREYDSLKVIINNPDIEFDLHMYLKKK